MWLPLPLRRTALHTQHVAASGFIGWQVLSTASASHITRRYFKVTSDGPFVLEADLPEADQPEAFWQRRYRRVKRRRAKMHHQIEAANDQMRVFYELGRQKLVKQ